MDSDLGSLCALMANTTSTPEFKTFFSDPKKIASVYETSKRKRGCKPPMLTFGSAAHYGGCWCCSGFADHGISFELVDVIKPLKQLVFTTKFEDEDTGFDQYDDCSGYHFLWMCKLTLDYMGKTLEVSGVHLRDDKGLDKYVVDDAVTKIKEFFRQIATNTGLEYIEQ